MKEVHSTLPLNIPENLPGDKPPPAKEGGAVMSDSEASEALRNLVSKLSAIQNGRVM